jgi:hypothetical protein
MQTENVAACVSNTKSVWTVALSGCGRLLSRFRPSFP